MLSTQAEPYEASIRAVALSMIGHARKIIVLPSGAERGTRFNNDEMALWRLESMFAEDKFLHDPLVAVEAALIDAAQADYYYAHEKVWESDDDEDADIGDSGC